MKTNLQKIAAGFFLVAFLFLTSLTQAQTGYPYQNASAVNVPVNSHSNIAADAYGNLFIADAEYNRVLMVNTNGIISVFAGTGVLGYWGDGGPAVSANLNHPSSVTVDAQGNVYIADTKNNRVRMVNTQGVIITVAGNGAQGFTGDGGPAIYASLSEPVSITVDANRNIYIADNFNNRIRMVNGQSGIIYSVAGNGYTFENYGAAYQGNNGAMAPAPQPVYVAPAPAPVTYQSYYDELAAYGQWVNTPEYGNVWVPAAGPGFVPYSTAGHWVYTSYGWTWVSDYSWGWCAFHYGRWDRDNYLGWFWVPGNEWAPAWVSWRSGNGYYGWAPLPPSYGRVYENNTYVIPTERYVFVQNQYMAEPDVYNHYQPREQNTVYITNTAVINRTYVDNDTHTTCYAGPPKEEVERYRGTPVKVYSINSSAKPGQTAEDKDNAALTIYRPKVEDPKATATAGKPTPAPTHIYAKEEIKPVEQREVKTQPKQVVVTHEPETKPQEHTEAPMNHPATITTPNKDVDIKQNQPQNNEHPATTAPNNQQVKPGQPATQVKDKQVGKDAKGHIIYQDPKGAKYYMDEKGKKVVVPPAQKPKEPQPETPAK